MKLATIYILTYLSYINQYFFLTCLVVILDVAIQVRIMRDAIIQLLNNQTIVRNLFFRVSQYNLIEAYQQIGGLLNLEVFARCLKLRRQAH